MTRLLDDAQPPTQQATSTTLTSSLNPSAEGDSVTFTAAVSVVSPGTGTPSGLVQFFDGATPMGDGALVGGVASFSISTLTAGSHAITAAYGGDASFTASQSSLVQTVGAVTPIGINVPITLTVGQTTIRLIFGEITEAGLTVAIPTDPCWQIILPDSAIPTDLCMPGDPCWFLLPPTLGLDINSRVFEINTTARFRPDPLPILPGGPTPLPIAPAVPDPPPIKLSFQMPFVTDQIAFGSLRVLHYMPGDPCNPQNPNPSVITPQIQLATRDFATRMITANVASLSPFIIAPASDTTAPVTAAKLSQSPNAAGWHNSDVMGALAATDHQGGAGVYAITYSAIDAQTIAETTVAGASASFDVTTEGTTVITFYATDLAANIETARTLTIRLDKTAPAITCPAGTTISAGASCQAISSYEKPSMSRTTISAGASCQAAIPDLRAGVVASDNFTGVASLVISQNPAPGTMVGTGTHLVTISVTDEAGNTSSCSLTIAVNETIPPLLNCPADVTRTALAGSSSLAVDYPPAQTFDNCPGATVSCVPPSGSTFPPGTTTVLCTAIDASGNTSQCGFKVRVNAASPQSDDHITFESSRDGNLEIYVMNADGSNPTRLTFNQAADTNPDWSPDRSKIAFTSLRNGNLEIYVMNANGTGQTRLTNNSAIDDDPTWSPDGTKIVFWSTRNGNAEIYVMNADGTGQARLTANAAVDFAPNW